MEHVSIAQRALLLTSVILLLALPYVGAYYRYGGFPPGFGVFPPQLLHLAPGFDATYFVVCSTIVGAVLLFLVAPQMFGFQRSALAGKGASSTELPWWFWIGGFGTLCGVTCMWYAPAAIVRWTFVPTWWAFIFSLDGFSYHRHHGRSLVTARTKEFVLLVIMSMLGWYLFEYLNYYALENWYYPNAHLVPQWVNNIWYSMCYTTVWPVLAEWYTILSSYECIRDKYANGPSISLPSWAQAAVFALGAIGMAIIAAYPYFCFWLLWIGPLLVLSAALPLFGLWSPYRAIATHGDWSPVVLSALAALVTAIFWESWNFGSQYFRNGQPTNPNYWVYNIPYVNVIHIFSEMPLLGYAGYLPFGIMAWLWWLVSIHMFNLNGDLDLRPDELVPPCNN